MSEIELKIIKQIAKEQDLNEEVVKSLGELSPLQA
jgi:hypothetical protein